MLKGSLTTDWQTASQVVELEAELRQTFWSSSETLEYIVAMKNRERTLTEVECVCQKRNMWRVHRYATLQLKGGDA